MLENRKRSGDEFSLADITPYLKPDIHCPQGGEYTVGPAVSNDVRCSFPGHTLLR